MAPDHAAIVASMIKEFESGNKRDVNAHVERSVRLFISRKMTLFDTIRVLNVCVCTGQTIS